jgi:hypothetical protein
MAIQCPPLGIILAHTAVQKLYLRGGRGESSNEAEALRFFSACRGFRVAIFFFVVLHPLVDVLFSVPQPAVDEPGLACVPWP